MVWEPTVRVLTERVELPDEFKVSVPMEVVPSRNVTVPVGAVPDAVTDAVRVMGFCAKTGFALNVSATAGFCFELIFPEIIQGPKTADGIESFSAKKPQVTVPVGPTSRVFTAARNVDGSRNAQCAIDPVFAVRNAVSAVSLRTAGRGSATGHPGPLFGLRIELPEVIHQVFNSVDLIFSAKEPKVAIVVERSDCSDPTTGDVSSARLAEGAVDT